MNIRPITDLKNRTKDLIREVVDGGQPIVITQNGKPRVVVMDAAEHDRLQDTLVMLRLLAMGRDEPVHTTAHVRRRVKRVLARARQK